MKAKRHVPQEPPHAGAQALRPELARRGSRRAPHPGGDGADGQQDGRRGGGRQSSQVFDVCAPANGPPGRARGDARGD
eukprot:1768087-Prymnesium_polylepis.1